MKEEDKMEGWKGFGVAAGQRNSCSKFGWFTYCISVRVRRNRNSELEDILAHFALRRKESLTRVVGNELFRAERAQKPPIFVTLAQRRGRPIDAVSARTINILNLASIANRRLDFVSHRRRKQQSIMVKCLYKC